MDYYKPSEDFEVNNLQSLVDLDVTGSKELWLMQCPLSHFSEVEGKELTVRLDKDGVLGGKEVELVSFASQDADATVIIPSQQETKIVGKISRRVLFVRFPEPVELLEAMKVKTQQKLVLGAVTSSSALRHSASTRSSREKRKQLETSSSKHMGLDSSDRSGKSKKKVKTEK